MSAPLPLHLRRPLRPVFLLCDVQERFRPLVAGFPALLQASATLLSAARILGRPIVATEQYPKALGSTCAELQPLLAAAGSAGAGTSGGADAGSAVAPAVFTKMLFSMLTPAVEEHLARNCGDFDSAVLFGLEAHVCVQQTALDLLRGGKQVLIPVEAVSSQRAGDRSVALQQLVTAGASVTTVESVLFTLLGSAEHERFKEVSRLLVTHNAAVKEARADGKLQLDGLA